MDVQHIEAELCSMKTATKLTSRQRTKLLKSSLPSEGAPLFMDPGGYLILLREVRMDLLRLQKSPDSNEVFEREFGPFYNLCRHVVCLHDKYG